MRRKQAAGWTLFALGAVAVVAGGMVFAGGQACDPADGSGDDSSCVEPLISGVQAVGIGLLAAGALAVTIGGMVARAPPPPEDPA